MIPLFDDLDLNFDFALVSDFESWKTEFVSANQRSDLIYVPANGAIKNWDQEDDIDLVQKNITKPAITCDDFMISFTVFGLTKVAKEQGQRAASSSLKFFDGMKPADLPINKNYQFQEELNEELVNKVRFTLREELKSNCIIIS